MKQSKFTYTACQWPQSDCMKFIWKLYTTNDDFFASNNNDDDDYHHYCYYTMKMRAYKYLTHIRNLVFLFDTVFICLFYFSLFMFFIIFSSFYHFILCLSLFIFTISYDICCVLQRIICVYRNSFLLVFHLYIIYFFASICEVWNYQKLRYTVCIIRRALQNHWMEHN